MKKLIALVPMFLLVCMMAYSQDRTPRTDARQTTQRARIQDGRQNGGLTNRETVGLRAEQRHIRRSERRAKADGDVSVVERRRLERKQDRASRHIRRAKHNPADAN